MDTLKKLISKSRPLLWIGLPLFYIVGVGFSRAVISPVVILQALYLSFPFSLFMYGVNDYYDFESDSVNTRKENASFGSKSERTFLPILRKAYLVAGILFIPILIISGNILNIASGLLLLAFAYFYSAKPIRLKTIPPLDSISNGFIYLLLPFSMGFLLNASLDQIPAKIFIAALFGMALHAVAAVWDYDADKKAGDMTVAVKFGRRNTILFSTFIFILVYFLGRFNTRLINLYIMISIISSVIFAFQEKLIDVYFQKYIKVMYLLGLFISLYKIYLIFAV